MSKPEREAVESDEANLGTGRIEASDTIEIHGGLEGDPRERDPNDSDTPAQDAIDEL